MSNVLKMPARRKRKTMPRATPAEVIDAPIITRLNLDPQRVLSAAMNSSLTEVAVVGFDADGDFYFAGSNAGGPDTLWLLEMAKIRLMRCGGSDA